MAVNGSPITVTWPNSTHTYDDGEPGAAYSSAHKTRRTLQAKARGGMQSGDIAAAAASLASDTEWQDRTTVYTVLTTYNIRNPDQGV